jgi:hypothetical protein
MKKIIFYFSFLLFPIMANAQETDEGTVTIGINGGIDNNINACRLYQNSNGNTFYSDKTQYNIAVDLGYMATPRLRPRIELKYVKMFYGVNWDKTEESTFLKTEVDLNNFDINIHLDYLLFSKANFQAFVSPTLKWEFVVSKDLENTTTKTTSSYNYYGVGSEYPKNIAGGAVSLLLKYNITKNIGVTLTPEYTLFFRNYVKSNDKPYQRLSANFGVEFKF